MSVALGSSSSIPISSSPAIVIPDSTAPQNQLQVSEKIQILQQQSNTGDTYKLLASSFDSSPGFLSAKITAGEFSIVSEKLKLSGFGSLTTTSLTEGTNLYWTQSRFDTAIGLKSTTNLSEGSNLYFTNARALGALTGFTDQVTLNTTARHSHTNKSVLDATTSSFTTALKAQYDAVSSGAISSVNTPLSLSAGVLSHLSTNGNKHVPTNATATPYDILVSGAAGVYTWNSITDIITNVPIMEATPSTSNVLGVKSSYIKTHVENGTSNIKHVTDANLTYINTTIPAHISSTVRHIPTITPTTDIGKFLQVNASNIPVWTTSSSNISVTGTPYISITGSVITAVPIEFSHTSIVPGTNITINTGTNVIDAVQRSIEDSPTNGHNLVCISSDWAHSHTTTYGAGSHIPLGGTVSQYIAGNGTLKDLVTISGSPYEILLGSGATGSVTERIASLDSVFPVGWSGAAGGVTTDLVITHNTGKSPVSINIWVNDGVQKTLLIGSAAYSTVLNNSGNTEITIASLSTITEDIIIYIQFK